MPTSLEVGRVVNPTGWHTNVACTVSDGSSNVHVKLNRDHGKMTKVYAVADQLTSRYRMPPILARIDIGDLVDFAMPQIPSQPATEVLIPSVIDLADRLHSRGERWLHVHAQGTRGEAKFWLDPEIKLAEDYGLCPGGPQGGGPGPPPHPRRPVAKPPCQKSFNGAGFDP